MVPRQLYSSGSRPSHPGLPAAVPRTFAIETPFPADDRSIGYERGSSVSPEWHSAVANAAMATADEVDSVVAAMQDVGADTTVSAAMALQAVGRKPLH